MFLGEHASDDPATATTAPTDAVTTLLVDAICGAQTVDASAWGCSRNGENKPPQLTSSGSAHHSHQLPLSTLTNFRFMRVHNVLWDILVHVTSVYDLMDFQAHGLSNIALFLMPNADTDSTQTPNETRINERQLNLKLINNLDEKWRKILFDPPLHLAATYSTFPQFPEDN
jgi:hypothetical protein